MLCHATQNSTLLAVCTTQHINTCHSQTSRILNQYESITRLSDNSSRRCLSNITTLLLRLKHFWLQQVMVIKNVGNYVGVVNWLVVSNMFFFHFNLGKTPIMTTSNILQPDYHQCMFWSGKNSRASERMTEVGTGTRGPDCQAWQKDQLLGGTHI